MAVVERELLASGPSNPYPEATAVLAAPTLGHLDRVFLGIPDETCERMRVVGRTGNARTLPISGTGSVGIAAAFVNLVGPGGIVVVGVNSLFGERMCEVASERSAYVVGVEAPGGRALDPADVLAGIPVDIDGWRVEVAYSGTQKCVGVAPGLAPFSLSERPSEQRVARPQSWYLDLELFAENGHRLPELISVVVPEGVDATKVRAQLLERFSIEIGGELGALADRVWRIGSLGHGGRPADVTLLLALAEVLGR